MMFRRNGEVSLPFSARLAGWFSAGVALWRSWLGFVMLFVALAVAVLSVQLSDWVYPQPPLVLILALSIAVTASLLHLRLRPGRAHLLVLLGGIITVVVSSMLAPADADSRIFGVFLAILAWLAGWLSIWAFIRRRRSWVTVAIGACILIVNLSFLPDGHYPWVVAYSLAAALFLLTARLVSHPAPHAAGGKSLRNVWRPAIISLLILVIVSTSVAWLAPQPRLPDVQNAVAARTLWLRNIDDSSWNIFARVPSKIPMSTRTTRSDLKFGASWPVKEDIDYVVRSDKPSYWRALSYDTYTSDGWENSGVGVILAEAGVPWAGRSVDAHDVVTYTVIPGLQSDILLVGGAFITASLPHLVYVTDADIATVTAPRLLSSGESYTVTAAMATPPSSWLAAAGEEYSRDMSRYLALPATLPADVRTLAATVTEGADTPYAKVMAIDGFLAGYTYSLSIKAPPSGADGVAYFLFEQKSGFCTYFASAMAVMLRAVGVPSRLAVGYVPGDPGDEPGTYLLRKKHSHAWVQAYFPGAGWVDLEATPGSEQAPESQVPIERPVVSDVDIAQLAAWDIWGIPGYPAESPSPPTDSTAPRVASSKLVFADALGLVIIIISVILLILLGLFIPVCLSRSAFQRWLWYVDRENIAEKTFLKMVRLASMTGLAPATAQTPVEFAGELSLVLPEAGPHIDTITGAYVNRRYGRASRPGLFEEAEILKARCRVYDALLDRFGTVRRFLGR